MATAATAKLSDIVDAMECQMDERTSYFNKKTGEVVTIHQGALSSAEEGKSSDELTFFEWDKFELEEAKKVVASNDYIPLPDKFDIDEWRIMERFCGSVEDEKMYEDLWNAIHGKGAFRYFKDLIHRFGIQDNWYQFRNGTYEQMARDWCEEHGIPVG